MKADDTLKITLFDMLKHETFISFEYARLSKKMNELNFKEKKKHIKFIFCVKDYLRKVN